MKYKREGITVVFRCDHPDIKNNICPTGRGNCVDCRHCKAVLSARDYFELIETLTTKTKEGR